MSSEGPFLGLFHHRWAVPVLAELERGKGAKFVTLAKRLGVGRDSLTRTLGWLMDHRLVARNPGYGHPMRPEYVLTERGRAIGPACSALVAALGALGREEVGLRKWSMPVLAALLEGADRFGAIEAWVGGVTARALSGALRELEGAGLVERRVEAGARPVPRYRAAPSAMRLGPALAALRAA